MGSRGDPLRREDPWVYAKGRRGEPADGLLGGPWCAAFEPASVRAGGFVDGLGTPGNPSFTRFLAGSNAILSKRVLDAGVSRRSSRSELRSKPLALAAPAVLAGCVLLAACGGSSPAQSAASREKQAETKLANFARCLREHGFNAEVASLPTGGRGLKIRPGKGFGRGASEAAHKACARYQPEAKTANLSPQQRVESEEAVQKFAKCMREHGIKVEASTKGGNIAIRIHAHPGSGPNPESPAFRQAQNVCQKLLPRKGG
jgi:hypothetical protein